MHHGKEQKDRTVPLPQRALPGNREELEAVVLRLHQEDLGSGYRPWQEIASTASGIRMSRTCRQ